MNRRFFTALLAAAVALAGVGMLSPRHAALAAPEPSILPTSWELNFKHGPLERMMIPVDGKPKAFWFMRYTVINNSGRDVLFTPAFEILADTGDAREAFKDVPNDIFKKIKTTYKNDFLLSPTAIFGKLLQGEDNAKDGVIIFTSLDPAARDFKLFVAGLSGETAEVKNPVSGKPVILQKTLELDYNLPGEAINIDAQANLRASKWIMK